MKTPYVLVILMLTIGAVQAQHSKRYKELASRVKAIDTMSINLR